MRALLATPLLILALTGLAHADPPFLAPSLSFDVGSGPSSVAVADLNADGRPDLVVANSGSNTVSVLLGNGDGSFGARTDFDTGSHPRAVAIADIDADGRPDLAVANRGSDSVSVLLGNGDGTFVPRTNLATGLEPVSVAVSDLDADGRPDLVVANQGSGTVSVLLGIGAGAFAAKTDFGTNVLPTSVAVADLNADGRPDLSVTCQGPNSDYPSMATVSVLFGNGDGTFATKTDLPTEFKPSSLAIGDLDLDGRMDLVVTLWYDGVVSVMLGNGDGTFGSPRRFGVGYGPTSVAIGDLDGDGRPDLAVANAGYNESDEDLPQVMVMLGEGDGGFASRRTTVVGRWPASVVIADVDVDGRPDLATANSGSRTASVLLGNGDGTFGAGSEFGTEGAPRSVAVADLNADGRMDLVSADDGAYEVSVLLGNGDGTFAPQMSFGSGGFIPASVAIGDLNADGRPDLAVVSYYWEFGSVMMGTGDGTFGPQIYFRIGGGAGGKEVEIGDFDLDGRGDVVVAYTSEASGEASHAVSLLLGNGDGTFAARTDMLTGYGPYSVAIGDLNDDGRPDLAVPNGFSHTVSVLLGNGDGTFADHVEFGTGSHPKAVAIGDFNLDGRQDLAVAGGQDTVAVLLGNGDGSFGAKACFKTGYAAWSVAVGDLDKDGRPDLAVANLWANTVSVLPGNGDGTFATRMDFGTGSEPASVVIGDFDADGRTDLAVANILSETISVLRGSGDFLTSTQISLVSTTATPDRVVLRWRTENAAGLAGTVYRNRSSSEWMQLGRPGIESGDVLRYEDAAVVAGERYRYRLGYQDGGAEKLTPEIEVEVPFAFRLALEGFRPNPALGVPAVAFTLADDSPATIEVMDVAGRRVLRREVRGLGVGRHVIPLEGARRLAPGVYMVRLHQAAKTQYARGVVVR